MFSMQLSPMSRQLFVQSANCWLKRAVDYEPLLSTSRNRHYGSLGNPCITSKHARTWPLPV